MQLSQNTVEETAPAPFTVPPTVTKLDRCWNAYFTSLAYAEKAAADQCRKIAEAFREKGVPEIAARYDGFAEEEMGHFQVAARICKYPQPLTPMAIKAYSGQILKDDAPLIARLVAVHLVFEPSALAFLAYMDDHAPELIDDQEWAKEIQSAFSSIVREEVGHVYYGRNLVRTLWPLSSEKDKRHVRRIVKIFHKFLRAGLPSFFRSLDRVPPAIDEMIRRYDHFYEFHSKEILA